MRKITSSYVFTCNGPPLKNGIVVCSDEGSIIDVIDNDGSIIEQSNLEYYNGIIVPGFINVHAHLELSHLKGKIESYSGIGGFIEQINKQRNERSETMILSAEKADKLMWSNGIQAVGDISNTLLTRDTKLGSKVFYHTFVESFGFHPSRADRAFEIAKNVYNALIDKGLPAGIVPHSPYSVSKLLFEKIIEHAKKTGTVLTIHNQESEAEEHFFVQGTGPIANHLVNNLGLDISHWIPSSKNSLQSVLEFFPPDNQLLLVHNTFTNKDDIEYIKQNRNSDNTFFILCPNSNMYIENRLPPVKLFREENLNICLGTDSLASNYNLSILEEMKTLQMNFPEIGLRELIDWACINGAKALKIDSASGSIETGKKSGLNLISGLDLQNMKLTERSKVKRLI